ncbi:hypothetical protein LOTGIDRAFT_65191, partial [Lottia gigantea]
EHKRLAGIIKGVHASLRQKLQSNDADCNEIWENHCQNKQVLVEYAEAMHHLAVDHWNDKSESRIEWCYQTIIEYFYKDGLSKLIAKDLRRQSSEQSSASVTNQKLDSGLFLPNTTKTFKIRLLDVGSCYNPFNMFNEFQTVGIDICPATPSVFQCDFLNIQTIDPLPSETIHSYINTLHSPIEQLPKQLFHVCVFSLLLEYFPSPHQRLLCCKKAQELLALNGLLLIITPDSHSQHRNAAMIKSWKLAVESLGFKRWKYVKKEHLHCLAFRKLDSISSDLMSETTQDLMYIPQDFNTVDSQDKITLCKPDSSEDKEVNHLLLNELPD